MSSLACNTTQCTFTRVDTNGYSYNPGINGTYPPQFGNETVVNGTAVNGTIVNGTIVNGTIVNRTTVNGTIVNRTTVNGITVNGITVNGTTVNGTIVNGAMGDDFVKGTFVNENIGNEGTRYPSYAAYVDDTTAPWTNAANQDMLSDTVALTRDFRGGMFNALYQDDQYNYLAPSNTEWALLPEGKTFEEGRCQMRFCNWNECFSMVGKPGVVHLMQEDVYYNIMFTNWTSDNEYRCYDQYCEKPYARRSRRMDEEKPEATQGMTPNDDVENENDKEDSTYTYPVSPPYPPYNNNGPGGGFSYVRDVDPFTLAADLPECPKCRSAMADPAVVKGPADDSFVDVTITGVTPANVTISIKAVSQDQNPRCNSARFENATGTDQVRPNAKFDAGNSTVQLRRTRTPGQLNAFRYTIYFDATSEAGSCSGQVPVCIPVEGFDCDTYLGYDATATRYCEY